MINKITLICSKKDIASINIKKNITEILGKKEKEINEDFLKIKINNNLEIIEINEDLIFSENLDKKIKSDLFIFLSRHKAISKIAGFYVHAIGNYLNNTSFGGKGKELCYVSAFYMKKLFQKIHDNITNEFKEWKIGLEVTHHGPFIEKIPCIFVEIGSTEKEWKNEKAGKIIANSIIETIYDKKFNYIPCVGFGGPHYAPAFLKYQKESDYAIGHIMPNYVIEKIEINEKEIEKPIAKTLEKVEKVLIDWKGIKSEKRKKIINILDQFNIEYIKL